MFYIQIICVCVEYNKKQGNRGDTFVDVTKQGGEQNKKMTHELLPNNSPNTHDHELTPTATNLRSLDYFREKRGRTCVFILLLCGMNERGGRKKRISYKIR